MASGLLGPGGELLPGALRVDHEQLRRDLDPQGLSRAATGCAERPGCGQRERAKPRRGAGRCGWGCSRGRLLESAGHLREPSLPGRLVGKKASAVRISFPHGDSHEIEEGLCVLAREQHPAKAPGGDRLDFP